MIERGDEAELELLGCQDQFEHSINLTGNVPKSAQRKLQNMKSDAPGCRIVCSIRSRKSSNELVSPEGLL